MLEFMAVESEPYAFVNSNGEIAGLVVEIAKLISKESNIPFNISLAPAIRVVRELEAGRVDLSILTQTPHFERFAESIGIVSPTTMFLITLKRGSSFTEHSSLRQVLNVGFIRGGYYTDNFWQFVESKNFERVPLTTARVGFEMLIKKRIDMLATTERTLAFQIRQLNIAHNIEVVKKFEHTPAVLYLSKNRSSVRQPRQTLHKALLKLNAEGQIEKLLSQLKFSERK
ncbi:MAG: hypothetical protein Alis3KO_07990 [Aliiglaciecola sp.]